MNVETCCEQFERLRLEDEPNPAFSTGRSGRFWIAMTEVQGISGIGLVEQQAIDNLIERYNDARE